MVSRCAHPSASKCTDPRIRRLVGLPQVESIHSRYKDRITYSHQAIQIDLTKVSTSASQEKTDSDTYELEVEFKDTQHLLAEARREKQGDGGGRYLEMVQEFLNNIRKLQSYTCAMAMTQLLTGVSL